MNIAQLRAALKEKSGQIKTLKTAAEVEGAGDDAVLALRTALDEFTALEKRIKDMEDADAAIIRAAAPIDNPAPASTPATPAVKFTGKEKLAIVMQSMIKAKTEEGSATPKHVLKSMSDLGFDSVANDFSGIQKAMTAGTGANGGFFMGDGFNREFIELLWPNTAFLRGMPLEIPMPEGVYRQAAGNAKPTAAYRAEAVAIAQSTPTLRNINASAKLLSGLVAMSNQVKRWSLGSAESYVNSSLSGVMGIEMDRNTLIGTGVSPAPLGLSNLAGIGSFPAAAGVAPSLAVVDSTLRKALIVFDRFPVLKPKLAWVMESRVIGYLSDLRDGNGNFAFPTMQGEKKTLKGYPVLDSGQIPVNLGAGTNESLIMLVSFGTIMHFLAKGLELAVSTEATVGGVNMFETDQTAIRATLEHDLAAQYLESVFKITGVQWGA